MMRKKNLGLLKHVFGGMALITTGAFLILLLKNGFGWGSLLSALGLGWIVLGVYLQERIKLKSSKVSSN